MTFTSNTYPPCSPCSRKLIKIDFYFIHSLYTRVIFYCFVIISRVRVPYRITVNLPRRKPANKKWRIRWLLLFVIFSFTYHNMIIIIIIIIIVVGVVFVQNADRYYSTLIMLGEYFPSIIRGDLRRLRADDDRSTTNYYYHYCLVPGALCVRRAERFSFLWNAVGFFFFPIRSRGTPVVTSSVVHPRRRGPRTKKKKKKKVFLYAYTIIHL